MQMPHSNASTETLLELGDFHLAALGADPATTDIGKAFLEIQTGLRTAKEAREGAERAEIGAEAIAVRAEVEVEAAIREIELKVLALVKKNRKLDPYAGAFPRALQGALQPVGRAQAAEARRIADVLAPEGGQAVVSGELLTNVTELRAGAARLENASSTYELAGKARDAAKTTEAQMQRRWREHYRKDHGLVLAVYPSDERRVESFFKRQKRAKKGGGEGGGGAPPA